MQLTRVAPITLAQKDSQFRAPCHHAIASEPRTPQAAPSVGVAQPIISDRKTKTISSKVGIRLSDSLMRSRNVMYGSAGGVRFGLASEQIAEKAEYNTMTRKPGRDPA